MGRLVVFLAVLALAASTPLPAQYPGQYPPGYPPGGYPGPGGGGGIPMPGRHKRGQKQSGPQQLTISADGKTVSNDGKKLVVATEDGRTLTMTVTPQTKFTRSGNDIASDKIVPRTTVHIEAAEDEQANLTATKVELVKDAPAETEPIEGDSRDEVRPTILDNPVDAPNRPILRHGAPKKSDSSDSDDDSDDIQVSKPATPKDSGDFTIGGETASVRTPKSASSDLISKAKEWSLSFTNGLPNFVCQQMTTRYVEQSRVSGWQPLDVITAKVVYEDGKEDYREITVGGRRTNKSMLELGGSTSTGEFASTLRSLFAEHSQTQFKFYQSTTVTGSLAAIYDFKVGLHNSDWFITVGGQSLRPAYSGSVWIERSTGEVRRIEMQADNIPQDFPLDSVEWAVDYDHVLLSDRTFLLPVHAENLGCQRGSSICTKNSIDFRDYHRYTGESTITFK